MLKIKSKTYFLALLITVVFIYIVLWVSSMPIICRLQLLAANNAPYTYANRWILFKGLLVYLLLLGLPVLTIFYLTLPIRLYYANMGGRQISYRDMFKKELWLFYIPFIIVYSIAALVFYIISIIIEPIFYVRTYVLVSDLIVLSLMIFNVYVSIYAVWRIIIGRWSKALINGFISSLIASLIGILLMIGIHGFGDYYVYKCDPSSIGVTVVNPNTYIFAEADSITLSKLSAFILWLIIYALLYARTVKKYYGIT